MYTENDKNPDSDSRRKQNRPDKTSPDPNSKEDAKDSISKARHQSIGVSGANSKGENVSRPGTTIAGGIISQLIEQNQNQMALHRSQFQ